MPWVLTGLEPLVGRGPPSHRPLLLTSAPPHTALEQRPLREAPGAQNETVSLQMPQGSGGRLTRVHILALLCDLGLGPSLRFSVLAVQQGAAPPSPAGFQGVCESRRRACEFY